MIYKKFTIVGKHIETFTYDYYMLVNNKQMKLEMNIHAHLHNNLMHFYNNRREMFLTEEKSISVFNKFTGESLMNWLTRMNNFIKDNRNNTITNLLND